MTETWDLVVVGAGPAGSAAALGALTARPGSRVLLLDRADFPRDKACGDGIAPHVLDVLQDVGVGGLLDDWPRVSTLQLTHGDATVERQMARPAWVVPRTVFDARLVEAATRAGAELRRQRVTSITVRDDGIEIDRNVRTAALVGADGAYSLVRKALCLGRARRRALAIRGYAPTRPWLAGRQVIVFGRARQPSYAWSFDRGDGLCNVGYGEVLHAKANAPTRATMLTRLDDLIPGATDDAEDWLGHHLPLSPWRWRQPDGRILLAGDAAGLINPMTGEGIYYAVATGVIAGRSAMRALTDGAPSTAGTLHRTAVRALLARHLRHTSVASRLVSLPPVVEAGIRAAARDGEVFDDLVDMGLGRGVVTRRVARGLLARVR